MQVHFAHHRCHGAFHLPVNPALRGGLWGVRDQSFRAWPPVDCGAGLARGWPSGGAGVGEAPLAIAESALSAMLDALRVGAGTDLVRELGEIRS